MGPMESFVEFRKISKPHIEHNRICDQHDLALSQVLFLCQWLAGMEQVAKLFQGWGIHSTTYVPDVSDILELRSMDSYELPCWCCKPELGSMQEKAVLWAAELSL